MIPRLNAILLGFITPDEPMWVYRAYRFTQALETRRWADTFQIGHPGVVTMWMGTLGIWWRRWRDAPGTAVHLDWVDRVAWVTPDNSALFRHLAPFLPPSRLAMAVLASLGVVGIYVLGRQLWDHRLALAGAVLVALDPFVIALSGLLHVDAPAMTFLLLSLLAWLNALVQESRFSPTFRVGPQTRFLSASLYALLSGLCGGLAMLSKSPSIFIVAAVGALALLFLALAPSRSWARAGRIAALGGMWALGLAAGLATFPAMWSDPAGVLRAVYGLAGRHLDGPHRGGFVRGIAGGDPGPWFYPTVLLYRLTPITLAGLALSLYPLLRRGRSSEARTQRAVTLALWTFALGYTAFITIGAKKFDRYLLPAFPALDLLAAIGWIETVRWLYARLVHSRQAPASGRRGPVMTGQIFAAVWVALAVTQAAMAFPSWPYYLNAYNPLAGGLSAALRTLPVGWGEGTERSAAYANNQPLPAPSCMAMVEAYDPSAQVIATGSPVTLSPLAEGEVLLLDEASRLLADRVLITALDRQIDPRRVARLISGADLVHTVHVAGQELLWLYDTNHWAEAEHLARYGAPGDLILCDAPSPYARHAPEGSVQIVFDVDEAEIVDRMNQWSAEHTRLWYLAYPSQVTRPLGIGHVASPITSSILRRQLETHAVRLDHVDLGYVTATLYILPGERRFAVDEEAFQTADFGRELAVVGGTLYEQAVTAESGIRFRLRWRALAAPQADYAPFVHLIDAAGHLRKAGRGEELLVDERYWPTSHWAAGEGAEQDYTLGLPVGLPPGRYQIVVGLADAQSGDWLPVLDEQGQVIGTTATVLSVDVGPAAALPALDDLRLAQPATVTWEDRLRLLGTKTPSRAHVGQHIVVEAGWLGLDAVGADDMALELGLVAPNGEVAARQTLPLSGYPTSQWRAGEVIHELYDLRLPAELEGGEYILTARVLDGTGAPLASPSGAYPLGAIDVSVQARLFELPQPPQYPMALHLGTGISLLGVDLPQTTVSPGQKVPLVLYWRSKGSVDTSYTVFVHLLDEQGRVQGQEDRLPARGRAPTSGWVEGQIVVDEYEVSLSEEAPPGTYRVEVGMYNARDMVRLPVTDAGGNRMPEDRVLLDEEVRVEPAN